jgi:hypothetical protein
MFFLFNISGQRIFILLVLSIFFEFFFFLLSFFIGFFSFFSFSVFSLLFQNFIHCFLLGIFLLFNKFSKETRWFIFFFRIRRLVELIISKSFSDIAWCFLSGRGYLSFEFLINLHLCCFIKLWFWWGLLFLDDGFFLDDFLFRGSFFGLWLCFRFLSFGRIILNCFLH